jgi:hypothetical protein
MWYYRGPVAREEVHMTKRKRAALAWVAPEWRELAGWTYDAWLKDAGSVPEDFATRFQRMLECFRNRDSAERRAELGLS